MDLRLRLDQINVSIAAKRNLSKGEFLQPRLWEDFRVHLQDTYRLATGETMAVLTIENHPAALAAQSGGKA
ncbi:hypothetical protein [Pararhizobium sp.]|uniref:hypothetical protein n=1 Tax=Pararhizobium sp. TaxID=1977563 RepID=UPI00271A7915|nr:hypothetical protein [Pararhizobium sp.]MDO9416978.1 hypothetical protein [Pararhizobium sp.]